MSAIARVERPPYFIPPTASILATPRNGLTVASTFSGAGGSCLGWRWAGYDVRWACEFHPPARDSYVLNHPDTPCDPRDVRNVKGADVLAAAGLRPGELDVLEGSPPCQSFSLAGKRAAGWGQVRTGSDGTVQRHDNLFDEFVRLVDELRPRAFAAENVAGLAMGSALGYYRKIVARLRALGYRVDGRVLDAAWLDVPQHRRRIFIVGVREDLGAEPPFPVPRPYFYTVADALPWLNGDAEWRQTGHGEKDGNGGYKHSGATRPAPTVQATSRARVVHDRGFIGTRPSDETNTPARTITVGGDGVRGGTCAYHHKVEGGGLPPDADADIVLTGFLAREAPSLQGDGRQHKKHPSLIAERMTRPAHTVPAMFGGGALAQNLPPGASRRFSILEVKRLCGFPDDYVLTGKYKDQWARLGNSVPPPMARHVAAALATVLLR